MFARAQFFAGMAESQVVEYKKLHSKFSTEEAKDVWGAALKKLKTNREEMLEKFMQDSKML